MLKPLLYLIKNQTYIKRLLFYFVVYFVVNYFYPFYTGKFFGFQILFQDTFLMYLFPGLLLALFFFKWDEMRNVKFSGNRKRETESTSLLFLLLALILFTFPFSKLFGKLPEVVSPLVNIAFLSSYYTQIVLGNLFLFLGIFGITFVKKFKNEILLFLATIALYIASVFVVENHWQILSKIILVALQHFFALIHVPTIIEPAKFFLQINEFKVFVGPTCSGIYSMATFVFLFFASIIILKKNKRLDLFKAFVVLFLGLTAVFLLNIIRVGILLLIGAYISKELSLQLFHEYLSAIFFIAIFLFYLYKLFPKILK